MDIERFIILGKSLGLEKEELQKFVQEQEEEWREKERMEREDGKDGKRRSTDGKRRLTDGEGGKRKRKDCY